MRYYKNMTKSEALKLFREYDIPSRDKAAIREAWNNFTDSLCKNRQITAKQYDTWSNPF